MDTQSNFELIIIGCGVAGASLAYFLTKRGMTDILILEKEEQPGYHSTGRAAAVLVELDTVPSVLELKLLSAGFFQTPPAGFSESPLLCPSGVLLMFKGPMWDFVKQAVPELRQAGATVKVLSRKEVTSMIPAVSAENFDGAVLMPKDGHLDVNEILWGYLRHARGSGARLNCREKVLGLKVNKRRCSGVVTNAGEYRCRWVVDAAGAWAENIRNLAGRSPIHLTPYRRTIITFAAPEGLNIKDWPFAVDYSHAFYFSPESTGLLASPMDEEPMMPCDARPDDLVVAQTIERVKKLTPMLAPKSIKRKWAGLRTFAPDQAMVIGEDPIVSGFFWLSGQGGAGIETSPAVGQIACDLIMDGRTELMDVRPMSPERFVDR
jgi:D-arginine dehydrogenase